MNSSFPPISSTIERDIANPKPVPLSGPLVVKKGSNTRSSICAAMGISRLLPEVIVEVVRVAPGMGVHIDDHEQGLMPP